MIRFVVPYLIYSIVALICIFLQSELFSCIEIFNAKPDLLILFVVLSGLKSDWKNGIAVGLLFGFWLDIFNGGYFGMNMVIYGIIGALSGMVGKRFPDRTYEGYFFTMVAMTLISGFLSLMLFNLLGANMPIGQSIAGIIFPMTFYTALISFLCLPLVWVYRHIKFRKIGRIDLLGNGVIFVRGNEKVDLDAVIARRKRYEKDRTHEKNLKKELQRRKAEASERRKRSSNSNNHRSERDRNGVSDHREPNRSYMEKRSRYDGRSHASSGQNRINRNRSKGNKESGRRK